MEKDIQTYSDLLSDLIQKNINNPNEEEIKLIRSCWGNEPWDSIVKKFEDNGSVWYVWWMDGVTEYIKKVA